MWKYWNSGYSTCLKVRKSENCEVHYLSANTSGKIRVAYFERTSIAASMPCFDFEYGEIKLKEEIKRDSARLKHLEIERCMQLNKARKEELKS